MVFIDNIRRGMVAAQDIYPYEGAGTPLVAANAVLTDALIESMRRHNIRFAYVKDRASHRIGGNSGGRTRASLPVHKPAPTVSKKLRTTALGDLEGLFTSITMDAGNVHKAAQVVRQLDTVVHQLVDSLTGERKALVNINDLKSYDEYTYHHSLSVAVLSIAIGQYLGFDRRTLRRLGMCAIMHDIGKTAVPLEVLNKPSRLDDKEFAIIKNHSPAGYDYLTRTAIGDEEIRLGVLAHHEKYDGSGYPLGLAGDKIPLWSRIVSVADVYDALTSYRPYRSPMQPAEAIEYIMACVGSAFDYDIVSAFMKKVELYPIASYVELSNGKLAVVLSNEHPMRPIIRMADTGDVVDLYRDRDSLSTVITRLLPEAPALAAGE